MYSGKNGCVQGKWFYSGKVIIFGKGGCTRSKVVVFLVSRCIWAKMVVFRQNWLYLGKAVVLG